MLRAIGRFIAFLLLAGVVVLGALAIRAGLA